LDSIGFCSDRYLSLKRVGSLGLLLSLINVPDSITLNGGIGSSCFG
jgi:hypothetical protein